MQILYWIPTLSFLQRIEYSLMANISLVFITILNWRKGQKIVPFHRIKAGLPFKRAIHWQRESESLRPISSCLKKAEVYKGEAGRLTGKAMCVCVVVVGHGWILEATASRGAHRHAFNSVLERGMGPALGLGGRCLGFYSCPKDKRWNLSHILLSFGFFIKWGNRTRWGNFKS